MDTSDKVLEAIALAAPFIQKEFIASVFERGKMEGAEKVVMCLAKPAGEKEPEKHEIEAAIGFVERGILQMKITHDIPL